MVPARAVRLLLVALSISSAVQALQQVPAKVGVPLNAIEKREPQATGNSSPQATNTDTSSTTDKTSPETTTTTTTTPTTPTTPTTTSGGDSTTPTAGPTTAKDKPNDSTTTPSPTPSKTSNTPATQSDNGGNQQTSLPESSTPITSTMTTIMVITNSNGETQLSTSEIVSTGLATISGDGTSTSGMSTSTRNTIIGVVVGVGGAIILCAVGLVAWRIRNRRRKAEENDGLIGYGGYTAGATEKPDSLTGPGTSSQASRTPFQSTLESYHAPTQVNQASNF